MNPLPSFYVLIAPRHPRILRTIAVRAVTLQCKEFHKMGLEPRTQAFFFQVGLGVHSIRMAPNGGTGISEPRV